MAIALETLQQSSEESNPQTIELTFSTLNRQNEMIGSYIQRANDTSQEESIRTRAKGLAQRWFEVSPLAQIYDLVTGDNEILDLQPRSDIDPESIDFRYKKGTHGVPDKTIFTARKFVTPQE